MGGWERGWAAEVEMGAWGLRVAVGMEKWAVTGLDTLGNKT